MRTYLTKLNEIIQAATGKTAPAIRAQVRLKGETVYDICSGWLDPDEQKYPVRGDTFFDLASVSKLFTTITFMTLVEQGMVTLDQPVSTVLPQFTGLRPIRPYDDPLRWGEYIDPEPVTDDLVDAGKVTFRQLFSHNSGLPAWRRFKDQPNAAAARQLALESDFFYPTGTRVIYSDVGLILAGMANEKLTGMRLDEAVRERVTVPLGLCQTRYLPLESQPYNTENIAPTELCAMRQYRVVGEVHDESTWRLGGIAGHAGVFSTAPDLGRFGEMLLGGGLLTDSKTLLKPGTLDEMTTLQTQNGDVRRGIGFMLRSPNAESFTFPFSLRSFGHTGFTGTSIWVDPEYELVVVLLSNRVYYGRNAEAISRLRVDFHRAVVETFTG